MATIISLLRKYEEPLPKWLGSYHENERFDRANFFSSRVVYYPGSGTDGHHVKLFNTAHAAHVFIYADYGVPREEIEKQLQAGNPWHFRGYHVAETIELTEDDLTPTGWRPHIDSSEIRVIDYRDVNRFGFVAVLECGADFGDDHGAKRLAILFLGADGIASYDALFCQGDGTNAPYAVLLQDHGFGGNCDRFARGGLLERIADRANVFPKWLVVGKNAQAWEGYRRAPAVRGDRGGMHSTLRHLYERERTRGGRAR